MRSLEAELDKLTHLDIEPLLEEIKAEGGGLEGLGTIIERIVLPLLGAHKLAILRLAREVAELRAAVAGEDAGD